MTRLILAAAAGLVAPSPPRPVAPPPRERERPVQVMKDVYPFLRRYCVSCHNDAAPRAERSLTGYQDGEAIRRDREVWDAVLRHVGAGSMPPAGERQPAAGEAAAFVRNVGRLRDRAAGK